MPTIFAQKLKKEITQILTEQQAILLRLYGDTRQLERMQWWLNRLEQFCETQLDLQQTDKALAEVIKTTLQSFRATADINELPVAEITHQNAIISILTEIVELTEVSLKNYTGLEDQASEKLSENGPIRNMYQPFSDDIEKSIKEKADKVFATFPWHEEKYPSIFGSLLSDVINASLNIYLQKEGGKENRQRKKQFARNLQNDNFKKFFKTECTDEALYSCIDEHIIKINEEIAEEEFKYEGTFEATINSISPIAKRFYEFCKTNGLLDIPYAQISSDSKLQFFEKLLVHQLGLIRDEEYKKAEDAVYPALNPLMNGFGTLGKKIFGGQNIQNLVKGQLALSEDTIKALNQCLKNKNSLTFEYDARVLDKIKGAIVDNNDLLEKSGVSGVASTFASYVNFGLSIAAGMLEGAQKTSSGENDALAGCLKAARNNIEDLIAVRKKIILGYLPEELKDAQKPLAIEYRPAHSPNSHQQRFLMYKRPDSQEPVPPSSSYEGSYPMLQKVMEAVERQKQAEQEKKVEELKRALEAKPKDEPQPKASATTDESTNGDPDKDLQFQMDVDFADDAEPPVQDNTRAKSDQGEAAEADTDEVESETEEENKDEPKATDLADQVLETTSNVVQLSQPNTNTTTQPEANKNQTPKNNASPKAGQNKSRRRRK